MRAQKLSMSAFGPYKEKQIIDFTQLGEEALFLITGPTGAGKTTIFDAMCFALYGKASGDDRDHDTLRSHFAHVDEQTEVSFQFALHQKEFEVIRSPKQNKRKARGDGFTEQPPQAELYEIINDEKHLLYAKVKEVNEAIEDMLQLDYEQFRKMVMIPQGEFRRLISENSKEREEILQKIFRTYFYEQMTKKLLEESKALISEIEQLTASEQQELRYVNWPEEYNAEAVDIKEAREKLKSIIDLEKKVINEKDRRLTIEKQELSTLQNKYFEAKELLNQFNELDQLANTLTKLNDQHEAIGVEKVKLKKAKIAQELNGYEKQISQREIELKELENDFKERTLQLNQAMTDFEVIQAEFNKLKQEEAIREELKEAIRKLKEDFEKHKKIIYLESQVQQIVNKYNQHLAVANENEEKLKSKDEQISKIEQETEQSQYITEQFFEFSSKEQAFNQLIVKGKHLKAEATQLNQYRKEYKQIKYNYDEAVKTQTEGKERLQHLINQQRNELAATFAQALHDGEACPVCGSAHHPNKAVPHSNSVTDEEIERQQMEVEKHENIVRNLLDQFVDIKSKGQSQKQIVEKQEIELSEYSGLEITTDNVESRILEWELELKTIQLKRVSFEKGLKKLKELSEVEKQLKKELVEMQKTIQHNLQIVQEERENMLQLQSKLNQLQSEVDSKQEDLSNSKIEEKETEYQEKINHWKSIQEKFEIQKDRKSRLQIEVSTLQEHKAKASDMLAKVSEEFKQEVLKRGFTSIEQYKASKLELEELNQLEQKIKTFEEHVHITKNRYDKLAKTLANKERPETEVLELTIKQLSERIEEDMRVLQKDQIQLDRHQTIMNRLQAIFEEKKKKEEIYYDVGELARLSRGDNQLRLSFERYVLSAFLDEILLQANIRLDKMTDHRYQLVRSDQIAKRGAQSGLDIEVIDFYTGHKRSVRTLSGGEGFKAALSLALGMADVVQAHSGGVELDTLFIDEGFGTLDELSLEQAIDCLSDLQKGNRMLGIISHVPKLKDEIKAQLKIETSHSGSKVSLSIF